MTKWWDTRRTGRLGEMRGRSRAGPCSKAPGPRTCRALLSVMSLPQRRSLACRLGRRKHQIRPGPSRVQARVARRNVQVEKQVRAAAGVDKQRICPSNVNVGGGVIWIEADMSPTRYSSARLTRPRHFGQQAASKPAASAIAPPSCPPTLTGSRPSDAPA